MREMSIELSAFGFLSHENFQTELAVQRGMIRMLVKVLLYLGPGMAWPKGFRKTA